MKQASNMTDEELSRAIAVLRSEKQARALADEEQKKQRRINQADLMRRILREQPFVLAFFAPGHARARYDSEGCSDERPNGAERYRDDAKEHKCVRCALIELRDCEDYELHEFQVDIQVSDFRSGR